MMKNTRFYLIAILFSVAVLAGCGGGSEKPNLTDEQKATKALTGSWGGTGNVVIDSAPEELVEDDYADLMALRLTFNSADNEPSTFSSAGGGVIFPNTTSGAWEWSSEAVIALTGGEISQLTAFSFQPSRDNATAIKFTFHYDQPDARVKILTGDYTVILSK